MKIEMVKFQKPYIANKYINIYMPAAGIYKGPDSDCFKSGNDYKNWIANDFTIIKGTDKKWHIFGITHPSPQDFINQYEFDDRHIHDAEWQLFHAVSASENLKDCLYEGSFADCTKILYPQERPGQENECWAPCIVKKENKYIIIYSPHFMRMSSSNDLYHWQNEGLLFEGNAMMRDPFVYYENGLYFMIYTEEDLMIRTSYNFKDWSIPKILQKSPFHNCAQESPCLFKKDGIYYLMWCIYDGLNGSYDNRTFIYASETIDGFDGISPIAMLKGHASEIITDENGDYYILSAFYPQNGVNIAKVEWEF
jgi:arabinan endo-1,5-alpha-L-arabinosidase